MVATAIRNLLALLTPLKANLLSIRTELHFYFASPKVTHNTIIVALQVSDHGAWVMQGPTSLHAPQSDALGIGACSASARFWHGIEHDGWRAVGWMSEECTSFS